MSLEVGVALVQQYTAGLRMGMQQMGSKLYPYTDHDPDQIVGKFIYFDFIGPVEMQPYIGRHSDVMLQSTPHTRRRGAQQGWYFADMVDTPDKLKMLEDPTSKYTRNAIQAAGRKLDAVIIAAARGTAVTVDENEAATNVVLPAAQKIAHGGTGMTVAKARTAKKMLDEAEAPDEGRVMVVTAEQVMNMLATTEVTSSDYNTVKALVNGEFDTFLGFKWVRSELLELDATPNRACLAWQKDWIGAWYGENLMVDVGPVRTKHLNVQVYVREHVGATRKAETAVVEIACVEV